jgi:hypothetical protein
MISPIQNRLFASCVALALIGIVPDSLAQTGSRPAQTEQDHEAHHPPATTQAPTPPAAQPGGMSGTMGRNGGPGMMGMMGDMTQMTAMMRNMMTMMSAQSGMMTPDVEGRIAALKTELKITDAQTSAWNKFADALRAAGGSMNDMYQQMMQSGPTAALPARLDRRETMLAAHLSRVKALKEALTPLYASFSDAQKKIADGIIIGPMGMM